MSAHTWLCSFCFLLVSLRWCALCLSLAKLRMDHHATRDNWLRDSGLAGNPFWLSNLTPLMPSPLVAPLSSVFNQSEPHANLYSIGQPTSTHIWTQPGDEGVTGLQSTTNTKSATLADINYSKSGYPLTSNRYVPTVISTKSISKRNEEALIPTDGNRFMPTGPTNKDDDFFANLDTLFANPLGSSLASTSGSGFSSPSPHQATPRGVEDNLEDLFKMDQLGIDLDLF